MAIAPPAHRGATLKAALFIAENQQDDGTWPNADFFHTLESLLAANTPPARKAVARAVPALVGMQRKDGAFGATAQEERALIGVKALVLKGKSLTEVAATKPTAEFDATWGKGFMNPDAFLDGVYNDLKGKYGKK